MDRKIFLKIACGFGVCSCIGTGFLSTNNLFASENKETDWKESFIKNRYAKLIDILDSTLDENTKNKILESLGKECAKNSFSIKYVNNIDGFFNEIHNRWGENASYDKEKKLIRIETPKGIVSVHLLTVKQFLSRYVNARLDGRHKLIIQY